ncbi:MAG: DHH family phosphoesterase [Thermoplasmatota archaeon]
MAPTLQGRPSPSAESKYFSHGPFLVASDTSATREGAIPSSLEAAAFLAGRASLVFVTHRHADADAVASACALAVGFGGSVWAPAGLSAEGARIAATFEEAAHPHEGAEPPPLRHPRDAKSPRVTFVLVDSSTWNQIGPAADAVLAAIERGDAEYAVVDHHPYGDRFDDAAFRLRAPERASTSEIAAEILRDGPTEGPLPAASARALLAGILSDSSGFRRGGAATLRTALALVEGGADIAEAAALLAETPHGDRSARIARLKAGQRARIFDAGGLLLATASVRAHDGDAASGLIGLGADCALVLAATPDGARISARAARSFPVNLGELLNEIARRRPEAAGGGHAGSAGMRAALAPTEDGEALLRDVLREVASRIAPTDGPREVREFGA